MIDNTVTTRSSNVRVQQWLNLRGAKWLGVIVLFASFYGHVIPALVNDWYASETFSYGFLVPLITGYLVWQRRGRFKSIAAKPSLWAAVPLLASVTLGLLAQAIGEVFSMRVSMIFALASTLYLLLGREYFKALRFPLFYLLLMIPAPYVLIKDLTAHLRYLDAAHAATILQLLGIPTFVESYFIHIPNMTLEVADVCSGVSSVFALFALGAVYASFLPTRNSLKAVLVLCTFPFAMIGNLIRIVVIAVLAYRFGPIVFQSTFHSLTGTTVFLLALIMLVSSGEFLRRKFPVPSGAGSGPPEYPVNKRINVDSSLAEWMAWCVCLVIFGGALFFANSLGNMTQVHLVGKLESLGSLEGYSAIKAHSPDSYTDPTADATLSVITTDQDNHSAEVFVGYRAEQTGSLRLRSPKLAFPDDWNSVWLKPAEIQVAGSTVIRGQWMLTRKGESLRLVLYWYQLKSGAFGGEFEYRLRQLKRALLDRRSDGAVIRLATAVRNDEPMERAQEQLRAIAVVLYPRLVKILPQ